ncbi:MAG: ACT domain-containing protein [Actinomycetes bacterium]
MSVTDATIRSDLQPQLDPTHLAVARFPAAWQPHEPAPPAFCALVRSDDEVTVVCAEELLRDGGLTTEPPLAIEHGWRRITFPGPLPWELVGFLADVATRLAGAQIPFTSLSGFTTDHVLVRAAQADLAVAVLRGESPPDQRPGTNP